MVVINLCLFLITILVFFARGNVFDNIISISYFIPMLQIPFLIAISLLIFLKRIKIVKINMLLGFFFLFATINLFLNIIFNVYYINYSMRFFTEMLANGLLFYLVYTSVYFKLINLDRIFHTIQYGSMFAVIPIFILASQSEAIRRIGAKDIPLPVAVNHVGHSLAITTIVTFYLITNHYKNKNYINMYISLLIFVLTFAATILTGSKAGLLGVLFYFVLLLFINFRKYFKKCIFVFLILASVLTVLGTVEKYNALKQRFTVESFINSMEKRLDVYIQAIQSTKGEGEFVYILGEPWRYQPINSNDYIPYPHNFFLSILLHMGLFPFIFFLLFFLSRFSKYTSKILTSNYKDLWTLFNGIWFSVFIYIVSSGRLTRVFTVFFIIGLIEGWKRYEENYLTCNNETK